MGIVFTAAVGPEKRGSHFEHAVIGQSMDYDEAKLKAQDVEKGDVADRVEVK